jgi:hypothetical protein
MVNYDLFVSPQLFNSYYEKILNFLTINSWYMIYVYVFVLI